MVTTAEAFPALLEVQIPPEAAVSTQPLLTAENCLVVSGTARIITANDGCPTPTECFPADGSIRCKGLCWPKQPPVPAPAPKFQ
jgi:hypothetical protein